MKKKTIVGSLTLASALAATALAPNVSAAENQSEAAPTTEEVNKTVTLTEVNEAKDNLDQAEDKVKEQEDIVAEAKKTDQEADQALTDADTTLKELKSLKKQATPENIQEQTDKVKETKQKIENLNGDIQAAESDVTKAEEELKAQQQAEEDAQKALDSAGEDVTKAEEAVEKVKKALEPSKLQEELEAAKTKVKDLESQLAQAKKELETAKQTAEDNAQAVTDAQTLVDDLTDQLKDAEKDVKTAKDTVQKAREEVEKLAGTTAEPARIVLSAAYIENLKKVSALPTGRVTSDEGKKIVDIQNALYNAAKTNKPAYLTAPDTTRYDVNNLPQKVREELSLFANDLINDIRKQIGTYDANPSVVTASSVAMANRVAKLNISNKSKHDAHDLEVLSQVTKEFGFGISGGIDQSSDLTIGENLYLPGVPLTQISLTEAKSLIYDAIAFFLFQDANKDNLKKNNDFGHALSITGLQRIEFTYNNVPSYVHEPSKQYLGIDFATYTDVEGKTGTKVFFNDGKEIYHGGTRAFDKTPLSPTPAPESPELKQAREDLKKALEEQTKATDKLTELTKQLTDATKDRDQKQNRLNPVPEAEDKVTDIESQLGTAETERDNVQQAIDEAKKGEAQLKKDLQNAEDDLEDKQKIHDQKQTDLDTAITDRQNLETDLKAKEEIRDQLLKERRLTQDELKTLEDTLDKLQNIDQLITDAEQKLEDAKENKLTTASTLKDAEEKLQDLNTERDRLEGIYLSLLNRYNAQRPKPGSGGSLISGKVEILNLSSPQDSASGDFSYRPSLTGLSTAAGASSQTRTSRASLPNTGSQSSMTAVLLGLALSLLSLGLYKKKETEI
ncbi:SEC10/PgrA surface exclusion domain-containing protein [Streptococcus merionis]|uniref:Putative transposon related peptidoglycan linked protein (LPXTG motif) n=1 Tax=Streptococcus merionis TaxID=400065 RepID=A0A239SXH4_9STRE|nr:SEC10/PgrA surface exclusion domain-containing protein [Streptococcus merionis]SNU90147.1 Putative transposon related peptidoglycan linked protein (LPXTG motif) [Streptococcus merionis]